MSQAARQGRRVWTSLAVVALVGAGSGVARADDGVGGFFQQIFGGGGNHGGEQALPQPDEAQSGSPPLTVRMHKHRRPTGAQFASRGKYTPEELKGVTIYTDRTLVPGDAVMTAQGVRIFHGSASLPHSAEDFVALSPNAKMPKTVRTELMAIDNASRSDFRSQ